MSLAYYLDDDSGMRAFLREAPRHGVTVARSMMWDFGAEPIRNTWNTPRAKVSHS